MEKNKKNDKKQEKTEKLAAALKTNLARRKIQTRIREKNDNL